MGREPNPLESTADLLGRAQSGDTDAETALLLRFLPLLQTWAHGRLSRTGRDLAETDDVVQIAILRALRRLPHFESRREGAFMAYLRQIVLNTIREEHRRGAKREGNERRLADVQPEGGDDRGATLEAYETALEKLPERQREAVMLRLEFSYSYSDIARAIESPTEDGARMTVKRGLLRLAQEMRESPE